MTSNAVPISSRARWTSAIALILGALVCVATVFKTRAASPSSGSISPSSTALSWQGTAAAGASATGEMTCVENPNGVPAQVNCDTYTITVLGTPAAWAGKVVRVEISWTVLAADYDLYVHKGSNAGPTVGSSTAGAPGTNEKVDIGPASLDASGTTVFTAHVVYSAAAAGDQYHGTATVVSAGPGATPTPTPPPKSPDWKITNHGQCCEGNLAASGNNTYVLLPVLVQGNIIKKSSDGGQTWVQKYPPAPASVPYGIEGDMQAFGKDVIFFGTELGDVVTAYSSDEGETFRVSQFAIASAGNDQAWSYLGALANMRPGGALPTDTPYVLAGWMRIGASLVFSFDGGLTFPLQTPLAGDDGSGPDHVVCRQNAHDPVANPPADTRVPNANFAYHKAGRYGAWGTDRKFYWAETTPDTLYVCNTDNFGATWTGVKYPLGTFPGSDFVVTHSAFDNKGTLYVIHGNKLYVSFNRGESFAFTHTLPRYGSARKSDPGSDQFFVVNCGTIHLAVSEDAGEGSTRIYYLRGIGVDTATPAWAEELVDQVASVRLDFIYIALDANGIPTISYTTPPLPVITASRNAPMAGNPVCPVVPVSAVSRKTHAGAGTFDVNLPLGGNPGVESRRGANSAYQVVITFAAPVTMGAASVSHVSGAGAGGSVSSSNVNGATVTVNLTGVGSPQILNIKLASVNDGATVADVNIPMAVVVGDSNGDGTDNSGDAQEVRNRSGQTTNGTNFRSDVNTDGTVNSGDAIIVRNNSGQGISTAPPATARSGD